MGLERKVDQVLEREGWSPGSDYHWEDGMVISDRAKGNEIAKALNASGEFSGAAFNKQTNKIEFGGRGASLRSKVIRLAHAKPELRPVLLPLLKTASVRKPLYGHDSPNNAFLVEDYPYGFKLRTQAKFWLEYKPGKGYRFVSQTMDPKNGRWNKPKASTYTEFAGAMYLDEKDHVQWTGLGQYSDAAKMSEFLSDFPGADTTILKKFVPMKVKFYQKLLEANAQGLSGWSINGEPQKATEADIGRNRKELEEWTDVMKKL